MSTHSRSKSRSQSTEKRRSKTRHILCGMAYTLLQRLFVCGRVWVDALIDFLFGLYWDAKRQPLPDLDAKHAFLADSATELARRIRNGKLTSEEIVKACIERIQQVNPIINAVTDSRYSKALDEAREADKLVANGLSEDDIKKKPFLGVPFTVKESIAAEGMLHTWGLQARRTLRAHSDADCVRLMKQAGCILVAVSNVPEVNKWQETRNLVFGQTNNPYHSGRTVGGSSGGEGALVASLASPVGLCSDIGGSTRMPSFYNGLFCLNVTPGTTNLRGMTGRTGKEVNSMVSVGVATKHSCDLAPLSAVLTVDNPERFYKSFKLSEVKVYYTLGSKDLRCSRVSFDLVHAMRDAIGKLSAECASEPRPYYHEGFSYMYSLWRYWMTREDDPAPFNLMLSNSQYPVYGPVELIKKLFGQSQYTLASIFKLWDDQVFPKVDAEWAETMTEDLRNDLKETLGDNGVLIFHNTTHPAPYHCTSFLRPYNFSYWGIFNAIKFPSVQVPLGLNANGLPLGVQVVATPHNEGLCLAIAGYLERQFGGYVPPCKIHKQ